MINSPIIFNINKSIILNDGLTSIHINDAIGNTLKEIMLSTLSTNSSPQFFASPGDYTAIASVDINDVHQVVSEPFHFRIINNLIEKDIMFENKNDLENLAWKNGGTYTNPNHLDVILSTLNTQPKSQLNEYKFSALSTQHYWWILIILLSIEWILRKREGLLCLNCHR